MKKTIVLGFFLLTTSLFADVYQAESIYRKYKKEVRSYPQISQHLVNEGLYFSAIPFLKEYMAQSSSIDSTIGLLIDEIISQVGVRQFEVLPTRLLASVNLPITKYILSKKYFRSGKHSRSLQYLAEGIPKGHSIEPYALMLAGSNYAVMGKNDLAIKSYRKCVKQSQGMIGKAKDPYHKRQLKINRDYCQVGIPRVEYAMGRFEDAHRHYQLLSKKSYIWPEILFEEAWNSFFMKDYNRVLGKLVTYSAPVLNYIFNPEIEVLQALTYLELCLHQDARSVVNGFYKRYQRNSKIVDNLLTRKKGQYKYFYDLAKSKRNGQKLKNKLLDRQMASILKDSSYIEMQEAFLNAEEEFGFVKQMKSSVFRKVLVSNLKQSLGLQRNLIGSYVYKKIKMYQHFMNKTFENMSYINLEVLARKKHEIYEYEKDEMRTRGDVANLNVTAKQYFWDFVGEFWADELGDYVFSLKSECKK